jgi:hypothetical protein
VKQHWGAITEDYSDLPLRLVAAYFAKIKLLEESIVVLLSEI